MYIIGMRKKREIVAGIYRITNLITGCVYVGSSKTLYKRLGEYKEPKMSNVTKDIKESIQTYGIENHEIKVVCEFDSDIPKKELETYEDALILLYVNRLGEDKVFNSYCNDKKKWISERFKLSMKNAGFARINISTGKFGKYSHRSKKVNQYTKDDIFVKTWDCMSDINRELGINLGNISECCIGNGKRNTAGGFKWKFKDA